MSHTGDAADQVVQMATTMATETAKTAGDLSIKGLSQILTMLIASGKNVNERKKNMIRDIMQKPHDVFLVPKDKIKEFAKHCKEYNIPFFVVHKTMGKNEPFVDVIVREMDRATVNRIAEQMGITLAFVEQAREDMHNLHDRADAASPAPEVVDAGDRTYFVDNDMLSQMLGEQENDFPNPMAAQVENIIPSAPLLLPSGNSERGFEEAVSVTSMIQIIRAERHAASLLPAAERLPQLPDAQRAALPPGGFPQLPAPKAPIIDLKGR